MAIGHWTYITAAESGTLGDGAYHQALHPSLSWSCSESDSWSSRYSIYHYYSPGAATPPQDRLSLPPSPVNQRENRAKSQVINEALPQRLRAKPRAAAACGFIVPLNHSHLLRQNVNDKMWVILQERGKLYFLQLEIRTALLAMSINYLFSAHMGRVAGA